MPGTALTEAPVANARTARRSFVLLPHEIIFGLFLLVTWLRLAVKLGVANSHSLIFLGCLLGAGAMVCWTRRSQTQLRWRVRLLYYPVAMGISFFAMESAIPALGRPPVDEMLQRWDRTLLGETPAMIYQQWSQPWLNDVLMLGYLFFFVHLIAVPAAYCVRDLGKFRQLIVGLFTAYGLGFLSYTLFPAGGPHRCMAFASPLEGLAIVPWTLAPVNAGSNCVDVFPSLHFAVSLYLLVFDWWHCRRRFWLLTVPCAILWLSTVLLRFHYFVDLLGGLVVAVVSLAITQWYGREERHLN